MAIPVDKLQKIATILKVSTDVLINSEPDRTDLGASKPLLKSFEKAKTLPPEKQKLIIELIESFSQ